MGKMRIAATAMLALALGTLAFASARAAAPAETVLYIFEGGSDGGTPLGVLVADGVGNLYGTASTGGSTKCTGGCGVVFKLSPPATAGQKWTQTVLYSFKGGVDGRTPLAGLAFDSQGVLYGTTVEGGNSVQCTSGCGTVFRLSPPAATASPWTEKVLYSFTGGANPAYPLGGVVMDSSGALYGTTGQYPLGGPCTCGTVFELAPPAGAGTAWKLTVLHKFSGGSTDGSLPLSTLLLGTNGELYGVAELGGSTNCIGFGCGIVFEMLPPAGTRKSWAEKVIYSFVGTGELGNGSDGAAPSSDLIEDFEGVLYGTTTYGPGCTGLGCGAVFKLTPPTTTTGSWTQSTLYAFKGGADGESPTTGRLAFGQPGILYGTTPVGGAGAGGTVFQLTRSSDGSSWAEKILQSFQTVGGSTPQGGVINIAGHLYGTASKGGASSAGAVFEITP
jgi:uncharacterized repeat protein (TIGR03803 family)